MYEYRSVYMYMCATSPWNFKVQCKTKKGSCVTDTHVHLCAGKDYMINTPPLVVGQHTHTQKRDKLTDSIAQTPPDGVFMVYSTG